MIAFTVVGLGAASFFLLWLALLGLGCAVFNNIGGNGSPKSTALGLLTFAAAVFAIYWMRANYSPFFVVVAA